MSNTILPHKGLKQDSHKVQIHDQKPKIKKTYKKRIKQDHFDKDDIVSPVITLVNQVAFMIKAKSSKKVISADDLLTYEKKYIANIIKTTNKFSDANLKMLSKIPNIFIQQSLKDFLTEIYTRVSKSKIESEQQTKEILSYLKKNKLSTKDITEVVLTKKNISGKGGPLNAASKIIQNVFESDFPIIPNSHVPVKKDNQIDFDKYIPFVEYRNTLNDKAYLLMLFTKYILGVSKSDIQSLLIQYSQELDNEYKR